MSYADLIPVLTWRNTPEIRNCMFSNDVVTLGAHRAWYERAIEDPTIHLMVMESEGVAVGFMNVTRMDDGDEAEWSFHTAPGARSGTGFQMCSLTLDYVFSETKIRRMKAQVLPFNIASMRLHVRLGFKRHEVERRWIDGHGRYYNIVGYELPSIEWRT